MSGLAPTPLLPNSRDVNTSPTNITIGTPEPPKGQVTSSSSSICRYGAGCTHRYDAAHSKSFWHPSEYEVSNRNVRTHYICNECGASFAVLRNLTDHLVSKTAWTNSSLVGCKISICTDYKDWIDAIVLRYKSGKHLICAPKILSQPRWLNMKELTFFIVERQSYTKESYNYCQDSKAVKYEYAENISDAYAMAQSVLFKIYGGSLQETGHRTRGHLCVTKLDRQISKFGEGSLLYGELLPRGANKAFGAERLNVANATSLMDLGMGTGKVIIQAYLQFPKLMYVYGVELSTGRYKLAEDALVQLVLTLGVSSFKLCCIPGEQMIVLELNENMSDCADNSCYYDSKDHESNESGGQSHHKHAFWSEIIDHIDSSSASDVYSNDSTCETNSNRAIKKSASREPEASSGGSSKSPSLSHLESVFQYLGGESNKLLLDILIDMKDIKNYENISRIIHIKRGNLLDVKHLHIADVVMLETDIPTDLYVQLCILLEKMKPGARSLTYFDMNKIWSTKTKYEKYYGSSKRADEVICPFRQLDCNKLPSDRYCTSWSVQRGHPFFLWEFYPASPQKGRLNMTEYRGLEERKWSQLSIMLEHEREESMISRDCIDRDAIGKSDEDCSLQNSSSKYESNSIGCFPGFNISSLVAGWLRSLFTNFSNLTTNKDFDGVKSSDDIVDAVNYNDKNSNEKDNNDNSNNDKNNNNGNVKDNSGISTHSSNDICICDGVSDIEYIKSKDDSEDSSKKHSNLLLNSKIETFNPSKLIVTTESNGEPSNIPSEYPEALLYRHMKTCYYSKNHTDCFGRDISAGIGFNGYSINIKRSPKYKEVRIRVGESSFVDSDCNNSDSETAGKDEFGVEKIIQLNKELENWQPKNGNLSRSNRSNSLAFNSSTVNRSYLDNAVIGDDIEMNLESNGAYLIHDRDANKVPSRETESRTLCTPQNNEEQESFESPSSRSQSSPFSSFASQSPLRKFKYSNKVAPFPDQF